MATLNERGYSTNFQDVGRKGSFIETLQYPEDIGDEVGNTSHYMVLFINELSNSSWVAKNQGRLSQEDPEIERSVTSPNHQRRNLGEGLNASTKWVATKINSGLNLVGAGTSKTEAEKSVDEFFNGALPTYKRTKAVIALPLPEVINNTYAADWVSSDNNSIVSNLVAMMGNDSGIPEAMKAQAKSLAVSKLAQLALGEGAANSMTKTIPNPKRELSFSGNLPRGFSYQWNLYARTPNEAKAIWDIIQMLKFHMLPEYDENTSGLFVNFPSTFDIEFFSHGDRNDWLYKTSTVALTNLDLNYTPAGTTAFLKKPLLSENDLKEFPQGSPPIGVSISANFMEMEVLYKNKIDPKKNFRFNQIPVSSGGTF